MRTREQIEQELEELEKKQRPFSEIIKDLNRLKEINDDINKILDNLNPNKDLLNDKWKEFLLDLLIKDRN